MFRALFFLGLTGVTLASPSALLSRHALLSRQYPGESDPSSDVSCLSLSNSCNATTVDLTNFYSYTSCIMLTTCMGESPSYTLSVSQAPANQPRLTEETFYSMSGGNTYMTQQNYVDAYYYAISVTPGGQYPDSVFYIQNQWATIAAWAGFCDTLNIPYSNFADWLEYSSVAGVCGVAQSCNATIAATLPPCVPQPITDNGSCAEMLAQCQLFVTGGLFQNEICVLASFCYAWSNTDVLLRNVYPSYDPAPTTAEEARLSEAVFYDMTGGAATMSQQNAIDAYYSSLTGTYSSLGGPFGAETPFKSDSDGPYPTSVQYVIDFWSIISAWTGFCATGDIPYSNLADYLSYAADSGYHPTC
ncbi:hypothetical protein BU15DRAFT_75132 [Melanogaster broomeanus]|nr:hypothetical protein BU15DRAFT_75132 [Melanogaster broomeanus]